MTLTLSSNNALQATRETRAPERQPLGLMTSQETKDLDAAAREELRAICASIIQREWSEDVWSAHESDDEFQTSHFCGGFDATENEFCFGFYGNDGKEYWFRFPSRWQSLASSVDVPLHLREPS